MTLEEWDQADIEDERKYNILDKESYVRFKGMQEENDKRNLEKYVKLENPRAVETTEEQRREWFDKYLDPLNEWSPGVISLADFGPVQAAQTYLKMQEYRGENED